MPGSSSSLIMPRNLLMKAHAATFALLMIASSLAGCTTAGTDGVPEVTLDDDDIETFLDDYFQDFVNNSSVVINQEIHYHNETTVNEGDDSSVRHYNGSSPQSYIVIQRTFSASEFELENRQDRATNTFNRTGNFWDWEIENSVYMTLEVSCSAFHLDGPYGSYWNMWSSEARNWYEAQWFNLYNDTIAGLLVGVVQDDVDEIRVTCDPFYSGSVYDGEFVHLGDISIPTGHGMICADYPKMYRGISPNSGYNLPGTFGPYEAVSVSMYQDGRYAGCGVPYGDGDSDTTISLFVEYNNLGLHTHNEYYFHFAYQLVEVTNGDLA